VYLPYQNTLTMNVRTIAALDTLPAQFALTPVRAKAPYLTNWQSIDTSRDDIAKDISSGKADGFGVKLGIPSGGICAIDIDGTAARQKLIDIMGDVEMPLTVEFASGKLDRSQYLFTIPQELWATLTSKSDKIPNDGGVEEFGFFWTGRQSVLPPSAHPETDGYFWVHSPDDAPIAPLPNPLLEYWLNLISPPVSKSINNRDSTPTIPIEPQNISTIPIERLLTKVHRSILNGTSQGGRNTTGASLARDLIGVAALRSIECDYRGSDYTLTIEGDAEDLFYSYCDGCNPPLSTRECGQIWKSAQDTADREPSIRSLELLKNCVRSYLKDTLPKTPKKSSADSSTAPLQFSHFTSSSEDGVTKVSFVDVNDERKESQELIGNHLIAVAYIDNPDKDGAALLLEFKTCKGEIRRWMMLRAYLAGDGNAIAEGLLSRGYTYKRRQKNALLDYIQGLGANIENNYTVTDKSGWVGSSFVLPHKTYGDEHLKFRDVEPSPDSLTEIKGTLEGWKDNVAAKCAGNSRLILGLGTSFAAPLLPIVDIESGGFHLVGDTSQGKTIVLSVAASVTGIKDIPHWRTTTNGLESTATAFNHLCLPLDEIGQAEAKDVGHIAYMLANGQGKARMKKDLTNRKPKTWRLMVLSSGESSLGNYMKTANITQKGGQEVRLPDVPAAPVNSQYGCFETIHGADTPELFATDLEAAVKEHHGTALDAFLSRLVVDCQDPKFAGNLSKQVHQVAAKLCEGTKDNAVGRVAKRFALLQVVLGLAHKYELLPFPVEEVEWSISTCFQDWLTARGGDGLIEIKQAIERIEHLLVTNEFSDRVYDLREGDTKKVRNLLAYRKVDAEGETEEFWVPPTVFDKEFVVGVNKAELVKELQRLGWLIPPRKDGKSIHQRWINSKPNYYYVFSQRENCREGSEGSEGCT
jgi:putative DNA primase/helicase